MKNNLMNQDIMLYFLSLFNTHISLCTVSALNYGEVVIMNLLNSLEKRNEGIYLKTVMN